MLFLLYFLLFFRLTQQQNQQFTHLSGEGKINEFPVFGDEYSYIGSLSQSFQVLVNDDSEMYLFYGKREDSSTYSDRIWSFVIENKKWKLVKGRRENDQNPIFDKSNAYEFSGDKEIGSRLSRGWKIDDIGGDIVYIFGGYGLYSNSSHQDRLNEIWRFNTSNNFYSIVNYKQEKNENRYANYTSIDKYDENNIPGGRYSHEIVKINEEEVFMCGGFGYWSSKLKLNDYLPDWWIFSTKKMQWKYLGGDLENKNFDLIYGETNVYAKENTMIASIESSAVLVNEEEILKFGGLFEFDTEVKNKNNIVQKYNISSNMWKFVSGSNKTSNYGIYGREYNDQNSPGSRSGHRLFKINEKEIVLIGGQGFSLYGYDYLNDEHTYNLETDQWKFTGKEYTKVFAQLNEIGNKDGSYSESTLFGGIASFTGAYVLKLNAIVLCAGVGYGFDYGTLNDCWKVYYGDMCYQYEHDDPKVCSGKGDCQGYNDCNCLPNYYGDECEVSTCNNVLSNNSNVCSGNGLCFEGQCLCFEQSAYNNENCVINEELKQFMENLWIYISIPIGIIIGIIIIIIAFTLTCWIGLKLRKTLKKFDGIEDVDLVLQEAKLEQNSNGPKIEVDKSLFQIEYKDLKLLKVIGDGGSASTVYLAEWKGTYCAYKGFQAEILASGTTTNGGLEFEEFEKEVKIFSSIHHPSILQFYGACINPPKIGLLLEFCSNGDIPSFFSKFKFKTKKTYSLKGKLRILKEIASGMNYLHSINVLHRDLKPENVLLDDHENAKIMDFGLSKLTENSEKTMTKEIGTSYYMAPEVYKGDKYSNKCDSFSFAVMIFTIITDNFFPYGVGVSQSNLVRKVAKSPNYRPKIKEELFNNCKFLIQLIKINWDDNPNKRNSFKEILDILTKEEKNCNFKDDDEEKTSELEENGVIPEKKIEELKSRKAQLTKKLDNLRKRLQ